MAVGPTAIYEQLTILLTLGVVSHLFSKRFHQSTLIGEIVIGILLAPSLLGQYGIFVFDPIFVETFAALGAIFLLFLIGLESDFRALYTRRNFLVALGGVALPLLVGFVTAWFLAPPSTVPAGSSQFLVALFVGATLTATSTATQCSAALPTIATTIAPMKNSLRLLFSPNLEMESARSLTVYLNLKSTGKTCLWPC